MHNLTFDELKKNRQLQNDIKLNEQDYKAKSSKN